MIALADQLIPGILGLHGHNILGMIGILGIVIVVIVILFAIFLNAQRTWGGWRDRGPMGRR